MITIEVGPGDTAEIIARRHPDVFDWRDGTLVKRAGIGDVRVVRTADDGDVYDAPLRNPLADVPAFTLSRLPQLDYREPVKVKPRSKRGQRKRMWR